MYWLWWTRDNLVLGSFFYYQTSVIYILEDLGELLMLTKIVRRECKTIGINTNYRSGGR